jgi:glutaredoxin
VKEFLSREGWSFTSRNVDEDEPAVSDLLSRGFRTVPVTFVGQTAVKGFDEAALRQALAAVSES